MQTLIIIAALGAAALVVAVALALTGWLPRLAARTAYAAELLCEIGGKRSRLSPRDQADLTARLWVPL